MTTESNDRVETAIPHGGGPDRCPVCGDQYLTHREKLDNYSQEESLRDDATFCSRELESVKGREQWVHVPEQSRSMAAETPQDGDSRE